MIRTANFLVQRSLAVLALIIAGMLLYGCIGSPRPTIVKSDLATIRGLPGKYKSFDEVGKPSGEVVLIQGGNGAYTLSVRDDKSKSKKIFPFYVLPLATPGFLLLFDTKDKAFKNNEMLYAKISPNGSAGKWSFEFLAIRDAKSDGKRVANDRAISLAKKHGLNLMFKGERSYSFTGKLSTTEIKSLFGDLEFVRLIRTTPWFALEKVGSSAPSKTEESSKKKNEQTDYSDDALLQHMKTCDMAARLLAGSENRFKDFIGKKREPKYWPSPFWTSTYCPAGAQCKIYEVSDRFNATVLKVSWRVKSKRKKRFSDLLRKNLERCANVQMSFSGRAGTRGMFAIEAYGAGKNVDLFVYGMEKVWPKR